MEGILRISESAKSIDAVQIAIEVLNEQSTRDFIIDLNTEKQLFEKGEDARGIRLDKLRGFGYAYNTIYGVHGKYPGKVDLGLPTDKITLYQYGDFYNSFQIRIEWPYIVIEADDDKGEIKLNEEWGGHILGLQDENKELLEGYILEKVINKILQVFLS